MNKYFFIMLILCNSVCFGKLKVSVKEFPLHNNGGEILDAVYSYNNSITLLQSLNWGKSSQTPFVVNNIDLNGKLLWSFTPDIPLDVTKHIFGWRLKQTDTSVVLFWYVENPEPCFYLTSFNKVGNHITKKLHGINVANGCYPIFLNSNFYTIEYAENDSVFLHNFFNPSNFHTIKLFKYNYTGQCIDSFVKVNFINSSIFHNNPFTSYAHSNFEVFDNKIYYVGYDGIVVDNAYPYRYTDGLYNKDTLVNKFCVTLYDSNFNFIKKSPFLDNIFFAGQNNFTKTNNSLLISSYLLPNDSGYSGRSLLKFNKYLNKIKYAKFVVDTIDNSVAGSVFTNSNKLYAIFTANQKDNVPINDSTYIEGKNTLQIYNVNNLKKIRQIKEIFNEGKVYGIKVLNITSNQNVIIYIDDIAVLNKGHWRIKNYGKLKCIFFNK